MANLPPVDFTGKDAAEIQSAIITGYESVSGRKLYPGDPVRLFLQTIATLIVQQRVIIDYSAKQNLLYYAEDDFLDQIGFLVGVPRLDPQSALTSLRYTLSAVQPGVFTVPTGEQATDGRVIFATTENLNIPAGQLTGVVSAEALTSGTIGNGLLAGQINVQVQPRPLVSSVVNTTTSSGGAETEGNEQYRERIRLAPAQFSVAGPTDAYIYWARTANQAIIDVSVESPSPGEVKVYPLMSGGVLPTTDVIDAVHDVLSSDRIRPLTDLVEVLAPTAINYSVNASYWISAENTSNSFTIQSAVQQAVNDYVAWQRAKIGRDIVPDELIKRMVTAGAKRVLISEPVFTDVNGSSVAQDLTTTVNYQGIESA
ncbi:baseplate J-like protein [Pararheinheimera phage vB_PsoM_KLER1-1]|nr:baseplate J-like protein [Pararheinheimera phage vB_PsoM_KLER1-1]